MRQITVFKNGFPIATIPCEPTHIWHGAGASLPYTVKHKISGYVNGLHTETSWQEDLVSPLYTWSYKV